MSERFYVNSALVDQVTLQGAEARHLAAVCRLRVGDQVYLFNGDGREYRSEITAIDKHRVDLAILESTAPARELPFRLWIACPLPKGDRGQFLIEKLTELGVTDYTPLRTQRSVVHPGEGRTEKLERYVIEASKQCGRNVLMRIHPLEAWEQFLARADLPAIRWLADPSGNPVLATPADCVIAVGPEGGFTAAEIAGPLRAGWRPVSLGPRVLRIETAAIVAAALCAIPG